MCRKATAVGALLLALVTGVVSAAPEALAAKRGPTCRLVAIHHRGPIKIGMHDYRAVVRLANPTTHTRRVISVWDVGSRELIRGRVVAHAAIKVTENLGYSPGQPDMHLLECRFAQPHRKHVT
jgi:hypothetical protein